MEPVPRARVRELDDVKGRVRGEPNRVLPAPAQAKVVEGQAAAARDKEKGTAPVGAPALGVRRKSCQEEIAPDRWERAR